MQVEAGVLPGFVPRQSFFSKGHYDSRFVKTEYQVYAPTASISPLGPGKIHIWRCEIFMYLGRSHITLAQFCSFTNVICEQPLMYVKLHLYLTT